MRTISRKLSSLSILACDATLQACIVMYHLTVVITIDRCSLDAQTNCYHFRRILQLLFKGGVLYCTSLT